MSLLGKNYRENIKSSLKNLSKKTFGCPSCKRGLRVPIRPGKTLRVTCPHCGGVFDIAYKIRGLGSIPEIKQKLFSFFKQKVIILLFALFAVFAIYSYYEGSGTKKDLIMENGDKIYQEV